MAQASRGTMTRAEKAAAGAGVLSVSVSSVFVVSVMVNDLCIGLWREEPPERHCRQCLKPQATPPPQSWGLILDGRGELRTAFTSTHASPCW